MVTRPIRTRALWLALLVGAAACQGGANREAQPNTATTPATHGGFPIVSGPHAVSCDSCHGKFTTFKQFDCLSCHGHEQPITDELHASLTTVGGALPDGGAGYAYNSSSCLSCHP